MAQERLGGLDLLRGIAALSVMGFHVGVIFPDVATPFSHAYLAVDFFFMLSGFVLTRTYHRRLQEGFGTAGFMTLRLKRLWPTIAVAAVIGLVSRIDSYAPEQLAFYLLLNLALVPWLAGGVVFPLNGVIWSIWFELVANLVHASALARMSRVALAGLAAAMAAVMFICVVTLAPYGPAPWDAGSWQGNFAAGLPRVMLSYVIGMLLYLTFGEAPRRALRAWQAPVLLMSALMFGSWLDAGWPFDAAFVIVVCPVVVLGGLSRSGPPLWLERISGDLSFPLYAAHVPVFILTLQAGLPWFAAPPLAIATAAAVLQFTQSWSWGARTGKAAKAMPA
ncbi:MAG: acyltransferase [Sphingomonadales bacterium]|nr:MAG: acyltransferase [Sphingomonadales bacterium]